jgi:hypothetical protein
MKNKYHIYRGGEGKVNEDISKSGEELNKPFDLVQETQKVYDDNIAFTKMLIETLNTISDTKQPGQTQEQAGKLREQLEEILTRINTLKSQYDSSKINSDDIINKVNDITLELNKPANIDDYIKLKLTEKPVFFKEQINTDIIDSFDKALKFANDKIKLLQDDINSNIINQSQNNINSEIENIETFISAFKNEINNINNITVNIKNMTNELKKYEDIQLTSTDLSGIIFISPDCIETPDMIKLSKLENNTNENLNLLEETKNDTSINLGNYLITSTILTGGASTKAKFFSKDGQPITPSNAIKSVNNDAPNINAASNIAASNIAASKVVSNIAASNIAASKVVSNIAASKQASAASKQTSVASKQTSDASKAVSINNATLTTQSSYASNNDASIINASLTRQKGVTTYASNNLSESVDNYLHKLMEMHNEINKFKKQVNEFKNTIVEYNILYIHVYHHLLFVVNYLKIVSMNSSKDYLIYQYLSKGITSYYLRIINRILEDMKNKKTNKTGRYFYKYYYINIHILKKFLETLYENWKAYTNKECKTDIKISNEKKITISKINLFDDNLSNNLKKCIFIFNSMKDKLDSYFSGFSPPVGIYLRINDWTKIKDENIVFTTDSKNRLGYIDSEALKKCGDKSPDEINNIASSIKFQEVFDPAKYDNELLAKYMSFPTFLSNNKSIMLITYGYSGVGKTFTIFGTKTSDGVLQSALTNIQQKESIYYRAYEIYGLAVPYKLYWDKKDPSEYYHFIYAYDENANVTEYDSTKMKNYLDEIKGAPKEKDSTFKLLSKESLDDFSKIVGDIDDKRKTDGRIKRTINNRESSRSIMVYDFKIKLTNGSFVNFVVMDLPGKEHIVETFINPPPPGEYQCITIKKEFKETIDTIDEKLLRSMAYFSPMSLPLIPNIAQIIIDEYKKKKFDLVYNYKGYNIKNESENEGSITYNIAHAELSMESFNGVSKYSPTFYKQRYAIEIMRNIIQSNKFDLLTNIYNQIFDKPDQNDVMYPKPIPPDTIFKYTCTITDSYAIAPFEGYYINENITGLIATLLKNTVETDLTFIKPQSAIYEKILSQTIIKKKKVVENKPTGKEWDIPTNYYNKKENEPETEETKEKQNLKEILGQTYFFRNFIGKEDSNGDNKNGIHIEEYWNTDKKYEGETFNYWLGSDEIYDYNKSFRKDSPPIAQILAPYFETNGDGNDTINNFYVFYVVSNENKGKCEKQIKLIADSKDFLQALEKFNKSDYDKIKAEKIQKKNQTKQ